MRRTSLAFILLLAVGAGACSSSTARPPRPACPLGTWKLSGTGMRALFGAELTDPNVSVTGNVTMQMAEDGRTTYQLANVIIGKPGATTASTGDISVTGVNGSIDAQTVRTVDTLDIRLEQNQLQVSSGGLPATTSFSIFISTSLERGLTGPATYTCPKGDLNVVDQDTNSTLLWNPTR